MNRENAEINKSVIFIDTFYIYGGVVVAGLVAPFGLWVMQQWLVYPVVIEELTKALVAWWVWRQSRDGVIVFRTLILYGLIFGISEAMMYVVNVIAFGSMTPLWSRLLFTVPMHMMTCVVQGAFWGRLARLPWLGFLLALIVHWGFNWMVSF